MPASPTRTIRITPIGFHSAVAIAANELGRYLPRLSPMACRVLTASNCPSETPGTQILLGTSEHLNPSRLRGLPALSDDDDGFLIKEYRTALYLIGSNPRSVLYAAYHLLEHFGVRFVRPGSEIIPRRKRISWKGLHIREHASYRHRGICIEGALRLEHVLGILDWMAKKKMNTYQLQFRHAGVFWRPGYALQAEAPAEKTQPPKGSRSSKTLTDQDCYPLDKTVVQRWQQLGFTVHGAQTLTDQDCYALDERVIQRCRQLGFSVHRVGHGWTTATVGTVGMNWLRTKRRVPRSLQSYVALVDGKRGFFHGLPSHTELCYSNPAAREAFASEVVQYARRHSEVDVIHTWRSDGYNTNCECDACARKSPSDWYVILINEICERLDSQGLPHKIVFGAHGDSLWPPQKQQLKHRRAILMFAPSDRCFVHPLTDARCTEDVCLDQPPLNRTVLFQRNSSYAATVKSWRGKHRSQGLAFDYHLIFCWIDGWGCDLGRVMAQDMKHLHKLGLDGMLACRAQRCFWPHTYTMHAMADMLWNRSRSVAAHRRKILEDTYGRAAKLALEYWEGVVKKTTSGRSYDHNTIFSATEPTTTFKLSNLAAWLSKMQRALTNAASKLREPVHRDSLRLLAAHASLTSSLVAARLGALAGNRKEFDKARAQARRTMAKTIRSFDLWVDPRVLPEAVESLFDKMQTEAAKEYPQSF